MKIKKVSYEILEREMIYTQEKNVNTGVVKVIRIVLIALMGLFTIFSIVLLFCKNDVLGNVLFIITGVLSIRFFYSTKIIGIVVGTFVNKRIRNMGLKTRHIEFDDKILKIYSNKNYNNNLFEISGLEEFNNVYLIKCIKKVHKSISRKTYMIIPKSVFKDKEEEADFKKVLSINLKGCVIKKYNKKFDCRVNKKECKREVILYMLMLTLLVLCLILKVATY